VPILFDREPPDEREVTETATRLAHLFPIIIAHLTAPKSVPDELAMHLPAAGRSL
jgi:hypothetical protein